MQEILPRQVGGEEGPTEFVAWDTYSDDNNDYHLVSVYKSLSADIWRQSGYSNQKLEANPSTEGFIVLQHCKILATNLSNQDNACKQIVSAKDAVAVKFIAKG